MFGRIFMVFLCVHVMTIQVAIASPFVEGNVPVKNESRQYAPPPTPRPQLPSIPLPPLPRQQSPSQGEITESPKKRWNFVGRIDERIIVMDTQSGEILSFSEGESLSGGCVATSSGVLCGKEAAGRKRVPQPVHQEENGASRLDELIFSAQSIVQKCVQLDETLKSEMVRTNVALKERETGIDQLKMDLETQKMRQNQLLAVQNVLQEQLTSSQQILEKTRSENVKIKDDVAFLLTTNAVLERAKGIKSSPPDAERATFGSNLKETGSTTSPQYVTPRQSLDKTGAEKAKLKDDVAYLLTTNALLERGKGIKSSPPDAERATFGSNLKETGSTTSPQYVTPRQSLDKTGAENAKIKDDVAYLLTTIALLERVKGIKYRLPGAEGTPVVLNPKEDRGAAYSPSLASKSPEESKTPIDVNNWRDK
jgi:cell division protein FtsB